MKQSHLLALFSLLFLVIGVFAGDGRRLGKRQRTLTTKLPTTTVTTTATSTVTSTTTATNTIMGTTTAINTVTSTSTTTETSVSTETETIITTTTTVETTQITTTEQTTITETLPLTSTQTTTTTQTKPTTTTVTLPLTTTQTTTYTQIDLTTATEYITSGTTTFVTNIATTTTTATTTDTTTKTTTETGTCSVTSPTLCPPLSSGTMTLTFDDDPNLSTDYKSPFPLEYKSFSFSGSAGWLLLNGQSPSASTSEQRGVLSSPYALLSQSYGMVRFGATNFTFDLEEFYVFGWTERIGNPPTLTMTIRTNKMGQKAYPYALPIRNGQGELMKVGSALGDIMQGIKWVELAVWRAWDWTKPGVEGNPVMGWTMDDILVRKRKSCGEPGSEWEQLRKRGIVW